MKGIDEALLTCADRVRLRKTNRIRVLDFCGCISEVLVQSNAKEAMQKGFLQTTWLALVENCVIVSWMRQKQCQRNGHLK